MVRKSIIFLLTFLLSIVFGVQTVSARVEAYVDRNQISDVETLKLVIMSKKSGGQPDLSPLKRDFDVLSTSKNSRVSFSNGKLDSTYEWIITLSPKRSGKLVIPAIKFNNDATRPIEINVQRGDVDSTARKDVFLVASIKPENPYVQSQLLYTLKLYHAVELQGGGLSSPDIDNAIVERLGNDVNYIDVKEGRRYRVTERRYAIFPQKSGKLEIPATIFDGQILDAGRGRSSFDPFSSNFFQTVRPIRARSKSFVINILPKPQSAKDSWWLPAENISLSEKWSTSPSEFRVGEPITRTLVLIAEGLTAAQIPDFSPDSSTDFKFYPDLPTLETSVKDDMIIGLKEQKIALVPTHAGKTVIPELLVNWWDTATNQARTAKISARTIEVLPALSVPRVTDMAGTFSGEKENRPSSDSHSSSLSDDFGINSSDQAYWAWCALLFFTLWVVTVLFWVRQYFRNIKAINKNGAGSVKPEQKDLSSSKAAYKQIKQSSLASDSAGVRDAVIAWARLVWPNREMNNLGLIAAMITQEKISDALIELNGALYSDKKLDWNGEIFWQTFSEIDLAAEKKQDNNRQALQNLYLCD